MKEKRETVHIDTDTDARTHLSIHLHTKEKKTNTYYVRTYKLAKAPNFVWTGLFLQARGVAECLSNCGTMFSNHKKTITFLMEDYKTVSISCDIDREAV